MPASSLSVTLQPLPSGPCEARFGIYVAEQYAGGLTVHSIDRAQGVFSYGIAIARAMRRRGVAHEAITQLLSRYAAQGFSRCIVEVYADNEASLLLHAKLGFAQTSRFLKDGRETVRLEREMAKTD